MTLYRRGTVTVEAIRASEIIGLFKDDAGAPRILADDFETLPEWVKAAFNDGRLAADSSGKAIDVKTTEGWDTADTKSWIIQRQTEHGELYPIPGKIFTDPVRGYKQVE